MTLKEIKQYFDVFKKDKNLFTIYDKNPNSGRLTPHKYLCFITKLSDTKFMVDGFKPTSNINTLIKNINDRIKLYEYDSEFYNIHYRKGVFEEYVITDYLNKLGFKSGYDTGNSNTFVLSNKNIYGLNSESLTLYINGLDSFSDVYKTGEPSKNVNISLFTDNQYTWVDSECNRTVDDIKNTIDGLLKPLLLTEGINHINTADKLSVVKNFSIELNNLINNTIVSEDIKQKVKQQLLEIAESL